MIKRVSFLIAVTALFVSVSVIAQQAIPKPLYVIKTYKEDGSLLGEMKIELFPLIAPMHVANFDSLVRIKLLDSTAFHRVVPGFVIQGGDPNSKDKPRSTWGQGDPAQQNVAAEFSKVAYERGIIGAARSNDPNSATSQFFICVAAARNLDANYTAYGRVVSGMSIADSIVKVPRDANDNPLKALRMFITPAGVNDSVPEAPLLNLPEDSLANVGPSRVVSWKLVPRCVLYQVEVSEDADFVDTALVVATLSGSSYKVNKLKSNTRYYWRVKANNGGAESPYSAVRTFTTTGITDVEQLVEVESYINVKTPTADVWNNQLVFNVQVSDNGRALFELFDVAGRKMWAERLTFDKGLNEYVVPTDDFWPGMYIYKYKFKGTEVRGKCMIVR